MSDQWYYQLFGGEFGPVKLDEVAQMLTSGELGVDDLVRHGADGSWVVAGAVSELKHAASSVAVNTAEVADDIDSFMLVDEQPSRQPPPKSRQPEMDLDIDSFRLVDEQQKVKQPDLADELADDLATDLDSFRLVDEQRAPKSAPPPRPRPTAPAAREETPEEIETRVDIDAAIWYFQGLDTELGPVPRSELVAMVRRSELGPKDLIRKGRKGRWLPSELLDGLYAEAAAPAPAPAPPTPSPAPPIMQAAAPPAFTPAAPVADTGEVVWYCYINDQEYGPMSMTDLMSSAAQGSVTPQSYVKYGSRGEWVLASTMPELFPPPPPPVPAPAAVPATAATSLPADSAGAERNELVQQLLTLLKQGLSTEMLGGGQAVAPTTGVGWYCNISGSVIGPVSIESLVQMVLQKRLFPDDMIRMGLTGEWFPAKTVPDLFPTTGPQGKSKKPGLDSGESVMERIDRMYREGQEAQAKADAARPRNEPVRAAPQGESSRAAAGDVLRNVSANIARGNSGTFNKPSSRSSSGGSFMDSLSGFELNAKTLGILAAVVVVGAGIYFVPIVMSSFATKAAYTQLMEMQAEVKKAGPAGLGSKSKEMLKTVTAISAKMKGGGSGSAKRDVSRMARALKEMIESAGKPVPAGSPEGTLSDFDRASLAFTTSQKAAKKRL